MNKISLFLTVLMMCFFVSCSSSDDGMRSNEGSLKAEFINTTVAHKSLKEYTSFNYNVRSNALTPLDGRLELVTIKGDKVQSEYFTIAPNKTIKVEVLVEGRIEDTNYIKSQKIYTRPARVITEPVFPKL
ncbi:hypothetical protein SAMN04488018_10175 [Myroides marinus]|uniref:Lipoprotein n=1 Tax=Myroides marinus TaxID=703342 RepID=A0A1H6R6K6_9FLAO|nr:hypothetical protein [Myroides marinus]SEI48157.1 hypothetical protein SAMN04488018_10175 [Myroides marinus]